MSPLVTLAEAKAFLRVDGDYEDATIQMLIGAASAAVADVADGWQRGGLVPDRVKLAVLTHVAQAFDTREATDLPAPAARLLNPLRRLDV